MKVLAIVRFNSGIAVVLNEKPELRYNKYGHTIVGTDGCFCNCLFYDRPSPAWEAFAGRKFAIQLENGEIEHCHGQWWDGVTQEAINKLGEQPIRVTANSIDSLRECYVFTGYYAIQSKFNELLKSYKGPIYDYWDYEMFITKNKYRREKHKLRRVLRKYKTKRRAVTNFGKIIKPNTTQP